MQVLWVDLNKMPMKLDWLARHQASIKARVDETASVAVVSQVIKTGPLCAQHQLSEILANEQQVRGSQSDKVVALLACYADN